MLQDKDRIFTNLYGFHSPDLSSAKMRGAWDGTKFLLEQGRDVIGVTATKGKSHTEEGARPAPQSSKSYVSSPTKDGEAVPNSPTTPEAGTPPAQAETRRDGSESKPGVTVDKDNMTS